MIDSIIDSLEAAVSPAPDISPNLRFVCFQELSQLWIAHYDCLQDPRDLAQTLGFAREAVKILQDGDHERIVTLLALADCGKARHGRMGKKKDLEQWLTASADILQLCPVEHPLHVPALIGCGEVYFATFKSTKKSNHLDAAITIGEQVLDVQTSDAASHCAALDNLYKYIPKRFRLQRREDDIDRAVFLRREKLCLCSGLSADRTCCLGEVASTLVIRYLSMSGVQDLNEAVRLRNWTHVLQSLRIEPIISSIMSPTSSSKLCRHQHRLQWTIAYVATESFSLSWPQIIHSAARL